MKKHIIRSLVALYAVAGFVLLPAMTTPVSAQSADKLAVCNSNQSIFGFSPWYACLPGAGTGEPRIESINNVFLIIFPILESLVKAGAYIAAAMIFVSIVKMIIARGNPGKVATAAEGIRDAVIGFIITLIAVAIVNFIASAFTPQ